MDPLSLPGMVLALLVRSLLIQPFDVPSGSMLPSVEVGDYLLVSKYAYGYTQLSLPVGAVLPKFELFRTAPKRGDIVVFSLPEDRSTVYIKRVVGLAGDRVQMMAGIPYLNGVPLSRKRIGDFSDRWGDYTNAARYLETLPDGASYEVMETADGAAGDDTAEFIVPSGHCYVLGDNRDNSNDSRFTLGAVPYDHIFASAWISIDFSGKVPKVHAVR